MAGEELQSALGGLAFSGMDNPYGIAASALGTATPGMISPYASTGQALGIGLGSILLQSLLGYQARQTALQDTLQANTLANQMLKLQTPEERVSFIGGLDESSAITGRLSNLSTALLQQEVLQKNELDLIKKKRMAELGAAGEFYATPEGKAARQFEIDKIAEEAKARRTPLDDYLAREEARKIGLLELERLKQTGRVDIETLKQTGRTDLQNLKDAAASAARPAASQQLSPSQETIIAEASTFADLAKQHRDRIAAMDPTKLKAALTSGFNLGETGFNQTNEAIVQLYRKANFGATLTGQEKKAAEIITGKNLTATKADIVAAWDTLITLSNKRAQRAVEVGTSTREQLTQMFNVAPGGTTAAAPDAKLKKLQELQAQLAELKARRGAK